MLVALSAGATTTEAQVPPTTRAPLGLDVSLPAAKRMAGARDAIAAAEWDAAIRSLDLLVEEFGESLIEVEPQRYVNVRLAVASTLARLPPDGLAAYRRRADPALELRFQEAAARRDPYLMRQVVEDGFAGGIGDDALDWLAEWSLRNGRIDDAREYWTALLPPPVIGQTTTPAVLRYPDARQTPADVCARLVLCSLLQGDRNRARSELQAFSARFGDATGALAGDRTSLAAKLEKLFEQSADWKSHSPPVSQPSWSSPDAPRLEGVLWSQVLATHPHATDTPPDTRPLVQGRTVLFNSPTGLRVISTRTGQPQWPASADDDGLLAPPDLSEPARPMATVGAPRYAGQIVGHRWYGRRGSLISVPAVRTAELPPTELVCFDLAAEGRLEWAVNSDEFPELAAARFSGPPLVVDDRLFVAVRRAAPQIEVGLACFNADDGSLQWVQPLCAALESHPLLRHRIHHDVLAAGIGLVFECPESGVIAARAADTGILRWATTYEIDAAGPVHNDRAPRSSSLIVHGGRLFVQPGDSNTLMALSAVDGRLLWSMRTPSRIDELLGVDAGRLIACGDHLWGFDVATGSPWRVGFDDPEGYGFGAGAISDGRAYWTTREDLFIVQTGDGRLLDRVDLSADIGLTGGNLSIADGILLIASPSRLTALGPRPDR